MENKGVTTLMVAGIIVGFLLLFVVLAIDFSRMYAVRGELQNAADAAALAGAGRLDGTNLTAQTAARGEACGFAAQNKCANSAVVLASDGSNTLSAGNDITVGNWDPSKTPKYLVGRTPINAVQVMARRTPDSPGGPVSLLFGKLIPGLTNMGVQRDAIAWRKPLAVPGVTVCIKSCDLATPVNLLIDETSNSCTEPACLDNVDRFAFTAFAPLQAPSVGANSDVVDFIWGRKPLPDPLCDICMTTNNTNGGGQALRELKKAFEDKVYMFADKTFDSSGNVTSWKVGVPLIDTKCNMPPDPCSACPPGCQGNINERYHVEQLAVVVITAVTDTGPAGVRGMTIQSIQCAGCPTGLPMGKVVGLVK